MWKGGRSIASNGYVLIRVGVEHHLADVRGYAYEHRLVAEEKLGRRLLPGEEVHHRNGVKTDNRPENIEVAATTAEHLVHHRGPDCDRRLPGEENPVVRCGCGCGETFQRFDEHGRPREYVSGHNPQPSPILDGIMGALAAGPRSRSEIAAEVGCSLRGAACALSRLRRRGQVEPVARGVWRLCS